MTTALTLVNRVIRELRYDDVVDFSDPLSLVVLDKVNEAISTIFGTWDWNCDRRDDGVMLMYPFQTCTITGGVSPTTLLDVTPLPSPVDISTVVSNSAPVIRIHASSATVGPNSMPKVTVLGYTNNNLLIDTSMWGSQTSQSADFMAFEYVLPDFVRKVYDVRYQELRVRLVEISRTQTFASVIPAPWIMVADIPSVCYIGGQDTRTLMETEVTPVKVHPSDTVFDSGAWTIPSSTVRPTGTTLMIWPVPKTAYPLFYAYLIQHSELAAPSDTLDNVDRALEDLTTQLAYARCLQSGVKAQPEAGVMLEQRVLARAERMHANEARDPGHHRVLGSLFDPRVRLVDFGTLPRTYGTGT